MSSSRSTRPTQKGDLGFKLKLVKSDDVGDESKAPAAAAQVLQDSSVIGVIGPAFSGPTKATAKTYGDANMGLISPSATNPDLTSQGFTTFHRVVPADNVEGVAGRRLAGQEGQEGLRHRRPERLRQGRRRRGPRPS